MIRYLRQRRDSFDCGPVAIINALKWAGFKASGRKDLKKIRELTGKKRYEGTENYGIDRVLRYKTNIDVKVDPPYWVAYRQCNIDELDEWLTSGGAAIISYEEKEHCHAALCTDRYDEEYYTMINDNLEHTVLLRPREAMIERLKNATVWLVKKPKSTERIYR